MFQWLDPLSRVLGVLLRFIYETVQKLGSEPTAVSYYAIAIIIMTLIYKLITIPMTYQSQKQSMKMQALQPQLQELDKKYGYDPNILQQKKMEFMRENNMNQGCSSCLLMLLSMLIVFALYPVMQEPAKYIFDDATKIDTIRTNFLWISDLRLKDVWYGLPLILSATQLLVSFLGGMGNNAAQDGVAQTNTFLMKYGMPIMFFFIFKDLASGLVLYWTTGNLIEVAFRLIMRFVSKNEQVEEGANG